MAMILKGEKLYVQEGLREEDYPLILKGYTDLGVMGFVNFAKEIAHFKTAIEAKEFVNLIKAETVWGIYTSEGRFIGYATLEPENADTCEYAIFILDKSCQGKGYGEETMRLMLDHIFTALKFKKVTLSVSELHKKALALYKKMGFRQTRLIPDDRKIFLRGRWIKSGTIEMELNK